MPAQLSLEYLCSRAAIHDAMMGYCRGVDRCDIDLLAAAFHDDAVEYHGQTAVTGADIANNTFAGSRSRTKLNHFIGNETIDVNEDVAYCEFSFMSVATIDRDGAAFFRTRVGRYVDRWDRRDGAWRIAIRIVVDDWSQIVPEGEPAVLPGPTTTMGEHSTEDAVYWIRTLQPGHFR